MRGYPKWFYRFLVTSFTILTLTGLLLIPNALDMRLEWDVPWRLAGDWRLNIALTHAILAFLVVSQMGALWSVHMRLGWRHHKNINSGISLVVILLTLIFTGIGIYYLGDEWSVPASALHILVGLIFPCLITCHIVMGRDREKLHPKSEVSVKR